MKGFLIEFGMTPSARSRVNAEGKEAETGFIRLISTPAVATKKITVGKYHCLACQRHLVDRDREPGTDAGVSVPAALAPLYEIERAG